MIYGAVLRLPLLSRACLAFNFLLPCNVCSCVLFGNHGSRSQDPLRQLRGVGGHDGRSEFPRGVVQGLVMRASHNGSVICGKLAQR